MYQFLIGNVRHSGQPDWISYIEILLYQFLIGNVRPVAAIATVGIVLAGNRYQFLIGNVRHQRLCQQISQRLLH